jgi:hypothetical protein
VDFTLNVVLRVLLYSAVAELVPGGDPVGLVFQGDLACDQMDQGAPERVFERVLVRVKCDARAILESYLFLTHNVKVNRVETRFRRKGRISTETVDVIGAALQEIADGRVMAHLLHVDFRTVLESSLVRLS